ncbi:bifunctional uroporphyrinogen-III C-methyltransferase/uroporphyrinogen-III synthase [Yimella sp. cx-51]|uniref:uroporphyrinogen-III synthase n=1 Tax=Yimella sp. cx-51 TaxID=2770551 RepID=UPI00165E5953|nr:bifunctional uroporphyrinogen-III C-methyltransferase/uroporphyrinogen-III synthase [Yimella sp. cx-51]MBC9956333.1 bifunctional uroporphyrinogen-III C-methyltransferase/uroporphyrinogen-III synthase [Yimella sp. cx-51]QTH38538.1 bifunctional uroporphyrinogen-III C-methyltransferase/uroporphyrinogen-III synthase [Yimella sp. cx-51]
MSTTPKTPAVVAFVGSGPGDPSLLTVRAADLLKRADVVVLDQVAREEFVAPFVGEGTEIVDAGHGETGQALTTASRAKLLVRTVKAAAKATDGALVVRLMDGDPATFNGLAEEATALHKAGIAFEIVPGVSAASAVPTYAGIPLTHNGSRAVHVISSSDNKVDYAASSADDTTVVLFGTDETLRTSLVRLRDAGRSEQTSVAVTTSGTTIHQKTHTFALEGAEAGLKAAGFTGSAVAVVGAPVAYRETLSWWETKPLFGWNVLVPRTKDQAGSMTSRLGDFGASSDVVPTISVEPPRTPQQMDRAIKGLVTGRYEWIGFTSQNAVKAVREKFEEFGLDARAFAGLKIAAVGGVTADALLAWGLRPDLVPEGEQSARGLLEAWPDYDDLLDPINRVFLPRADIATDTLVAGLQEIGWEVDDVTAYRTVRAAPPAPEVREAIKSGKFDAVCFTSSSTVRNLVGIAGKPHATTVVACIGPATAKTAEEHGLRVDVMAPEPSAEALVDALADFGRSLALSAAETGEEVRRPSQRRSTSRRKAKA